MASDGLYLEWAQKKDGPCFYVPATALREGINRKVKEIMGACTTIQLKLVERLTTSKDAGEVAASMAGMLIALHGDDLSHEGRNIANMAVEAAQLLALTARLDMVNRNLVEGATYVLDEAQLREYGL